MTNARRAGLALAFGWIAAAPAHAAQDGTVGEGPRVGSLKPTISTTSKTVRRSRTPR